MYESVSYNRRMWKKNVCFFWEGQYEICLASFLCSSSYPASVWLSAMQWELLCFSTLNSTVGVDCHMRLHVSVWEQAAAALLSAVQTSTDGSVHLRLTAQLFDSWWPSHCILHPFTIVHTPHVKSVVDICPNIWVFGIATRCQLPCIHMHEIKSYENVNMRHQQVSSNVTL